LLQVGTGGRAIPAMAVAALAERRSLLEQRIRKLFSKAPEVRLAQAAFLMFGAILVVGIAVMVPGIANERGQPVPELDDLPADVIPSDYVDIEPIPEASELEEIQERLELLGQHVQDELQQLDSEKLPPPPEKVEEDLSAAPVWTPVDVYPLLKNRAEVERALESEYPPLLRDAGIGGTVKVWFFIDEAGEIVKTQVHTSSGHQALDEAAMHVARIYEFSPATNEGGAVPVWVALDVTFKAR